MSNKRASPRPGRDQKNDTSGAYLSALAVEVLDQEQAKLLRERRKIHRSRAEENGVELSHLDRLYKMRDEDEAEVEKYFRGMWGAFTSLFSGLATQMDMFVVKAPREKLAAFRHKGLMVGLKGEAAEPPKNLVGDELQAWQDGFNEGAEARQGAEVTLADTLAEALKTAAAGGVVDGTGGKRTTKPGAKAAAKVAAVQAQAADFKADNPDVKLPGEADGSGNVTIGDGNVTVGATDGNVTIGTAGPADGAFEQDMGAAIEGLKGLADTPTGAEVVGLDGEPFEAPKEELDKQVLRPKDPDETDPLMVDGVRHPNKTRANEARKLSQSQKAAKVRAEAGV